MSLTQKITTGVSEAATDEEVESWGTMTDAHLKAWRMGTLYGGHDAETSTAIATGRAPAQATAFLPAPDAVVSAAGRAKGAGGDASADPLVAVPAKAIHQARGFTGAGEARGVQADEVAACAVREATTDLEPRATSIPATAPFAVAEVAELGPIVVESQIYRQLELQKVQFDPAELNVEPAVPLIAAGAETEPETDQLAAGREAQGQDGVALAVRGGFRREDTVEDAGTADAARAHGGAPSPTQAQAVLADGCMAPIRDPLISTPPSRLTADQAEADRNVKRARRLSGRQLRLAAGTAGVLLIGSSLLPFGRGDVNDGGTDYTQTKQPDAHEGNLIDTGGVGDLVSTSSGAFALGSGKHRGSPAKDEQRPQGSSPSDLPSTRKKRPRHAVSGGGTSDTTNSHTPEGITRNSGGGDPQQTATTTVIQATRVLTPGQSWYATLARMSLRSDGNLVIYDEKGRVRWAANTSGSNNRVVFQADGNLVVYSRSNQTLWSSDTAGNDGARLVLQGDGNVVISQGSTGLWSSRTEH